MLLGFLALMIPILAILVYSPVGKAISQRLESGADSAEIEVLTARLLRLEQHMLEQDKEMEQLRSDLDFSTQLLEGIDGEVLKQLRAKSE